MLTINSMNTSNEIWEIIKDFPNYSVSTLGRVKNNINGKLLSLATSQGGYYFVALYRNNGGDKKYLRVNRLVAMTFIPNPHNKSQVNHIDENKKNNRRDNLEWATPTENRNHGTSVIRSAKSLSPAVVQYSSTGSFIAEYPSAVEARIVTGVSNLAIAKSCRKERTMGGGYQWRKREDDYPLQIESAVGPIKVILKYSPTGELLWIYSSIKEASEDTTATLSNIVSNIKGRKSVKTVGGHIYREEIV